MIGFHIIKISTENTFYLQEELSWQFHITTLASTSLVAYKLAMLITILLRLRSTHIDLLEKKCGPLVNDHKETNLNEIRVVPPPYPSSWLGLKFAKSKQI